MGSTTGRKFSDIQSDVYDVVIVGGGVSGLTLAAALKASPYTSALKVALIEGMSLAPATKWDPSPDQLSNRVSSITPASQAFLQKIGVWDYVYPERVRQYDDMRVWDGVSGARIQFDSFQLDAAGAPMAYMTENLNLQQALLESLAEAPGDNQVKIFDSTKVEQITNSTDQLDDVDLSSWPAVKLSNGSTLRARLLIGADGVNSPVRSYAGIESRGWDYGQHGLVATLTMEWDDRQDIAWQRFLPTGPIALLPMPGGKASLVWSTTPKLAAHLKSLDPKAFCTLVNAAFRLELADLNYLYTRSDPEEIEAEFEWRDGMLPMEDEGAKFPVRVVEVQENTRASFPLRMRHCDSYVAPRVALVGDAAHTTHPLAGQGLNLGQGDVASLMSVIERAVVRGADIGDEVVLQEYWAERYPANHVMLGVVDKLQKLYCTDSKPVVALRSAGLEVVASMDWIKKLIMKQATGI
ncbi:ubiquinone biosynthesis monooxygenase COQ6 [Myxozyma melibiosi]|uniref:Ubiquinone biosynthesis monooxygenase COQ6, mitochondrial n=1 Tax=Myxozyma melibiosi TaxID=54550 RepID=A0ABR1FFU0_9ASCO